MARISKLLANVETGVIRNGITGAQINSNGLPYISSKEKLALEVQYITAYRKIDDVDKYTGFAGKTITSSAVIDNDFNHIDKGKLATSITALTPATEIEILTTSLANNPQPTGTIQLINASGQSEVVSYTQVVISGLNYLFTVDFTPDYSYSINAQANTNDPPLIKTVDVNQDDKDTGLFIINLDANSFPYLQQIEGSKSISGCLMEHQVRDDQGDKEFDFKMSFVCNNSLDDDSALPPPTDFPYYTSIEVDSLLAGKMDLQPLATTGNLCEFDSTGQAVDSGFNLDDFGVDTTNQSTALLSITGNISAGATTGTVVLPSITGEVIDNLLGEKYLVSYTGGAEVAITNPENPLTLFYLDKDSNLLQQNTNISPTQARRGVYFSGAQTLNGVDVDAVADAVATTPYSPALSVSDLSRTLGVLTKDSDVVSANGANLSINTKQYNAMFSGINFRDKENPNIKTISAKTAPTLTRYWQNGSGGYNTDQSPFINPLKWDDGTGTLADVGINQFQNFTVYVTPHDEGVHVFYGQRLYSSRAGALAGTFEDQKHIDTTQQERTLQYIGTIVVRQDTTALNDTSSAFFTDHQVVAPVFDNIVSLGDGLIQNRVSVTLSTTGTISTVIITALEEDSIEFQLDGTGYELSSPQSIDLTHGTDVNPQMNYLYIEENSGQPQVVKSVTKPEFEIVGLFANIIEISAGSATMMDAVGPYSWHQVVDSFNNGKQSHIRHINDILRENAKVKSGVTPTTVPAVGGGSATTSYFNTTSGIVRQLHPHSWPVYSSLADGFYVANDETTAFDNLNGLHEITTDVNGDSLTSNNRIWNLFVFGTQDNDGSYAKVFVNKPNGYYSDQTEGIADSSATAIYDFPAGWEGTAFPIARLTMKWTSGGNFETIAITDLRAGIVGGGSSSSAGVTSLDGLTDTPSSKTPNAYLQVTGDGLSTVWTVGGLGEANTASNAGTGQSLVRAKDGIDLPFYGLNSLSDVLEITVDEVDDNIDLNINESNITVNTSQVSNFSSVLAGTTNTTPFTPTADYHVATKAYTDGVLSNQQKKNYVINGSLQRNDHGTSFAYTAGDQGYKVFNMHQARNAAQGQFTVLRTTNNNDVEYRTTVDTVTTDLTGTNQWVFFDHRFEKQNVYELNGKDVTISFDIETSHDMTLPLALRAYGSSDGSYVTEFSTTASTKVTITKTLAFESIAFDQLDNTIGLLIKIAVDNNGTFETSTLDAWQLGSYTTSTTSTNWSQIAGAWMKISNIQMIEGDKYIKVPAPSVAQLAVDCARYWRKDRHGFTINAGGVETWRTVFNFDEMRATPSTVVTDINGTNTINQATANSVEVQITTAGSGSHVSRCDVEKSSYL